MNWKMPFVALVLGLVVCSAMAGDIWIDTALEGYDGMDGVPVLAEAHDEKGTEFIADSTGTGKFIAAGTSAEVALILDGAKFSPSVVKTGDGEVTFTSGEKDFFLFDNPDIEEKYTFVDGNMEESVTIKERKEIAYRIEMPVGAKLVRQESGEYFIDDPSANDMIDGYIVVHKAWGKDANGERVTFDYIQSEPGVLTLVWPKGDLTDAGKEIAYPLYIDPLFERSYDLKLLLHFNPGEDGNASIFHFVDSSHQVAPINPATTNTAINSSSITAKFGSGSFRSTGTAADVISTPKRQAYNISNQLFAVNLWANFSAAIGNNKSLIYGGDSSSAGYSWILYLNNNTAISFDTLGDVASTNTCRVGAISTGVWHQFTVIKNTSTTLDIYQNQTLICTKTAPSRINLPDSNNAGVVVGYGPYTGAYSLAPMTGYIDEVSVWIGGQGREIQDFPAAETTMYVSSAYSSGGYGDDNSTVSLMHFNDVNGGLNFTDQTGKVWTRTGTGNNMTTVTSKFDGSSMYATGASGSYIGTPTAVSDFNMGTGDFTIDFWMNATGMSNGGILTTKNASGMGYYLWWQPSTGKVVLSGNTSSSTTSNLLSSNALSNNTWNHIAFTRSGTTLNVFVNGELNNTATIDATREFNATAPTVEMAHLTLGLTTGTFAGYLDEFRVSKKLRWSGNFTVPSTPYEITNANFTTTDPQTDMTFPVTISLLDTTPDSLWTDNGFYTTWGDGSASGLSNPSHDYSTNGTFTVSYESLNNNMSSTMTRDIVIGRPNADFHATPTSGTAALETVFDDDSTNLTPIINRTMDFGDGTTSTDTPPWTHVYSTFGTYSPNLTVCTADGCDFEYKRDYIITATEQQSDHVLYPHEVRIMFVSQKGMPVANLPVTAQQVNSTLDGTNWLTTLFAISPSATDINGTLMSGITDTQGSVVFTMVSSGLYAINAADSSRGISFYKTMHPSEGVTVFVVNTADDAPPARMSDYVSSNLSVLAAGSTVYLNVSYNDTGLNTSSFFFFVKSNPSGAPVYNKTYPGTGGLNQTLTISYSVTNTAGDQYIWGFNATNTRFGYISQSQGITLKGTSGVLFNPFVFKDRW